MNNDLSNQNDIPVLVSDEAASLLAADFRAVQSICASVPEGTWSSYSHDFVRQMENWEFKADDPISYRYLQLLCDHALDEFGVPYLKDFEKERVEEAVERLWTEAGEVLRKF
jgi:hypothetical protein